MDVYLFEPDNQRVLSNPHASPVFLYRHSYGARDIWFMLPHIIIALMFLLVALSQIVTFLQYQYDSKILIATLIDKEADSYNNRGKQRTDYSLTYHFFVDNREYSASHLVPESLYRRYAVGDGIPVIYVISSPSDSMLTENNTIATSTLISVGIALFLNSVVYVNLFSILDNVRSRRRLHQKGTVIMGEVSDCSLGWKKVLTLTVYFEVAITGEYITEKRIYRYKRDADKLPANGTPIAIFYLDPKTWEVL